MAERNNLRYFWVFHNYNLGWGMKLKLSVNYQQPSASPPKTPLHTKIQIWQIMEVLETKRPLLMHRLSRSLEIASSTIQHPVSSSNWILVIPSVSVTQCVGACEWEFWSSHEVIILRCAGSGDYWVLRARAGDRNLCNKSILNMFPVQGAETCTVQG